MSVSSVDSEEILVRSYECLSFFSHRKEYMKHSLSKYETYLIIVLYNTEQTLHVFIS